ncbi:TetR/AcrR family transcriptional regulator [Actinomadura kijaniata]|uniref:AcrR family transcriptional regulator n=1 Tax=Actinomadura namibiensis TaxID=182080 RepID=A0A7W3LQG9_ACTNM|nr:TetR/AcrR family transcriptional regulator [Actinomadura namibiensis]MBA8952320.1 AcrR family transcriptional regulator [Actinomadura namibiensis]
MTEPADGAPDDAPAPGRTRRGAAGRTPDEIRALILDAAAECLVEGGFANGRLLSAIARRAGISRPTLYKYGGTVEDIREALVRREIAVFAEDLIPRLRTAAWTGDDLVDLLVFVVGYGRRHPLLQAALRDVPEIILPVFTVNAESTIRRISKLLQPLMQEHIDAGRVPPVDVSLLVDALFRVAVSLILVRGPLDLDDPETLRGYLDVALGAVADLRAQPVPS